MADVYQELPTSERVYDRQETNKDSNDHINQKSNIDSEFKYNKPLRDRLTAYTKSSKFIIDSSIFCLTLFSTVLYILSLAGCHDTQTACLVNLSPQFFHKIVIFLSLSGFIYSYILFLTLQGRISKVHIVYTTFIYMYLTLIYDTGADLTYHGQYNRTVFIAMVIGFVISLYIINVVIFIAKKKFFKTFFVLSSGSIILVTYLTWKLQAGCDKWTIGLKDVKINNVESSVCRVITPSNCWVELLDGLLDVSWLLQESCDKFRKGERTELMKYLDSRYHNSSLLGYPITTNFTYLPESYHGPFFSNVMTNMVDLKNVENNNKTNSYSDQIPEIILEFNSTTNLGNITINIAKNEKLVQERNSLKSDNDTLINNILVIYIDSISRQHFMRKMKKTGKFIEKYMDTSPANFTSYQFMKYHTFIFFTQPNVNPMFYGESMIHNNGTNIIKHFHNKGFITGQSTNICARELYDIEDGYIKNITWEPFDHENIALFCDPNFFNPENPFTPYMGPYSVKKRCLYGKNTFEYVLDYGEEFWKTYINERKFLRVAFEDAHEGTGEVARYLDEYLIQFLEKFESRGWLNDTAVLFVSDHGNNMIGFYNIFNCEDFILEKTLGTLFWMLPANLADKFGPQLKSLEQTMVTPYDVYNSMLNLINEGRDSKYFARHGDSLFKEFDTSDRNCKKYSLDLKDLWCRCKA